MATITRLVLDKVSIEVRGIGTAPISDYVKGRLDIAFDDYNRACESLKAEYVTKVPAYPTVEKEWFRFCDWAGAHKVVSEFLAGYETGKRTFPQPSGVYRTRGGVIMRYFYIAACAAFRAGPNGRCVRRSLTKEKTVNIQRLRNLTTGRLHTKIGHVYEDLEIITGEKGLMTHMLPRVVRAVEPWLREHVTEPRFWDGKYDTAHTGDYALPDPTADDRAAMFERYKAQPNPLEGKTVIAVQV